MVHFRRYRLTILSSIMLISVCMWQVTSVMSDSVTPWTVVCLAPLSMEFSRLEYWSGLSFPIPGDLPSSGIELVSLRSPVLADGFFITSTSCIYTTVRIFCDSGTC